MKVRLIGSSTISDKTLKIRSRNMKGMEAIAITTKY